MNVAHQLYAIITLFWMLISFLQNPIKSDIYYLFNFDDDEAVK